MPYGSEGDFSTDELAMIPPPEADELAQMQQEAAQAGQTTAEAPPADDGTPAPPAPAPAAPAPAAQPNRGEPRAALRAARRGEQLAIQEAQAAKARAEELERQLQEAMAKLPAHQRPRASQEDDGTLSDDELASLEADYDQRVAKLGRMVRKAAAATAAAAPAAAPAQQAEPEFIPVRLTPEFQEAVDSVPDLLDWQLDPNQERFRLATRIDAVVAELPAWKDKPLAERLAEVARRVNADMAAAPSQKSTRVDPASVIAGLQRPAPSTLSDLQGGGGKEPPPASNLQRYEQMSEDEILSHLGATVG